MPRLTAARRLVIMSGAIAYAEDQHVQGTEAVPLTDVAGFLNESVEDVRESLDPLEWVEMSVPEGIVDLLGAIRLKGDVLRVDEAWWRRLALLTPGEAARLYAKAAAAASLDRDASMPLRTAMEKLRRTVGEITVVEGDAPHVVRELRAARDGGTDVIVDIEGHDRTLVTSRVRFSVVAVFRQGDDWMVTLRSVGGDPDLMLERGDVITVPVGRVLGVIPAGGTGTAGEADAAVIDPEPSLTVTLEYPAGRDWVLDPFETTDFTRLDGDRIRSTVRVWGTSELKTLLLRLGPDATVVSPEEAKDIGRRAAAEILELYAGS